MRRRMMLGGLAAIAGAPILVGMPVTAHAAGNGPPTVTPEDLEFGSYTLRPGSAHDAGLTPKYVDRIIPAAARFLQPDEGRPNPSHAGFVVLAARRGVIAAHGHGGYALRYESYDADDDTAEELPEEDRVTMSRDTIFDVASMSKLFTAMVATQLAEEGKLDLEAPVMDYVPAFADSDEDKEAVTVMHLMRHVTGLPAALPLYEEPDDEARLRAIYDEPLGSVPGEEYLYSDLNLITLHAVIAAITGNTLDVDVAERVTEPLGLRDTGYNPAESDIDRIAATEYQPELDRGMIRGRVHDENAASFENGVAGHAGLFSTAADIAVFGQALLNGGEYDGVRILGQEWVRELFTNFNADMPQEAGRGLGWQINQHFYMDAMSSPVTVGHTGFTGTCIVIDPIDETLFVLLSNRVHPTRNWGQESDYRRAPARELARAVPVEPTHGEVAWYSGLDESPATLTVPLEEPVAGGTLSCRVWYDTEPDDVVSLLARDGDDAWHRVELRLRTSGYDWTTGGSVTGFSGRDWIKASARLPQGTTGVRWSYSGDSQQRGRGVYVDGLRIREHGYVIFDSERPSDAARIDARGWDESAD